MSELRYAINNDGNLIVIDENNEILETIDIPIIKNILEEKQDLIKYLEDKIKDIHTKLVKIDKSELDLIILSELSIYQEILDKIKEDNYE